MVSRTNFFVTTASLAVLAAPVLAQDQLSGLTTSGEVAGMYSLGTDGSATSVYAGLDLSYRAPTQSSLTFGVDAGFRGYEQHYNFSGFTGRDVVSSFYFEAVVGGTFGTLALGQTRTATEMILKFPEFSGSPVYEIVARSISVPFQETYQLSDGGTLGVRFDATFGGADLSFSVNNNPDFGLSAQAAGSYKVGAFTMQGAVEYEESSAAFGYLVGGQARFGKVDIGASYYDTDLGFSTPTYRAFGTVNWTDSLSTTAQALYETDGIELVSVDVRKSWATGAYVDLSAIADSDDVSGNLAIGFKF